MVATPSNSALLHCAAPANWNLLLMKGPDALDFLHRLSTVHVKELEVGQGSKGFFLTPQGKIRAYFTLWRLEAQDFAFEFEAGQNFEWKTSLLAYIDQFTFTERFELTPLTTSCVWLFGGDLPFQDPYKVKEESDLRFFHHGSKDYGKPWLTVWGTPEKLQKLLTKLNPGQVREDDLEAWRIDALSPRLDVELTESTVPL